MSEIDDPIPREHAACIVRAVEINKKILNVRKCMEELHLVGIEKAFSTVLLDRRHLCLPCSFKSTNNCLLPTLPPCLASFLLRSATSPA